MKCGSSPDASPRAVPAKRFCGLLDVIPQPVPDVEQPLSPAASQGSSLKPVSNQHSSKAMQSDDRQQEPSRWPCSPAALSQKLASCRSRRCLILQLCAALGVVLLFTWPWILPGLVFRKGNTNWVVPGPEVDPITYEVLPSSGMHHCP